MLPTGWGAKGMGSQLTEAKPLLSTTKEDLGIRCTCSCVPTTHKETEKKFQSHHQSKVGVKWGDPAQGWRLRWQREVLVSVNRFVSHDLDISKCRLSHAGARARRKRPGRGREASAFFFNICIITSNTIGKRSAHTEGRGGRG